MKRIASALVIATIAIAGVAAQGYGQMAGPMSGPMGAAQVQAQQAVTIEGKLALVQGHPAVVVKDKTYFVRLPQFMYGFVDGLKEGATVKLEGYEIAIPYAPNSYFFQAVKLTLGTKTYDLSQSFQGAGMMGGRMGGMGGGMGGNGRWDDDGSRRGRW